MPESPGTRRDSRLRNGKVQNRTGGRRSRRQQDVYFGPKDLDEKVSELHLPALGAELTVLTQLTQASKLKALSRVSTTVIVLQSPVRSLVAVRISFSPSVVLVLWCSLPIVNPSAPHRRACTFFRWQRLRVSRPRQTFSFHLTGNFDVLTLDHMKSLMWIILSSPMFTA